MNILTKGSFIRDVSRVSNIKLLLTLKEKIKQATVAPDSSHIPGLKLLRGYSTHYRIKVETEILSFRIGVVIRGSTIWMVRFLPRKTIYRNFP